MRYNKFTKIISLILSSRFVFCYADNIPDYMAYAHNVVELERTIMAPTIILQIYQTDLLIKKEYINDIIRNFNDSWNNISTDANNLKHEIESTLIQLDSFDPFKITLDEYGNLIQKKQSFALRIENLRNAFMKMRKTNSNISDPNFRNLYSNYCTNTANILDLHSLSMVSRPDFSQPAKIPYSKLNPFNAFQNDPRVNAAGWLTFEASTIALLASAIVIKGPAFLTTFVSVAVTNSAIIGTFSGPLTFVVLGAAAIATIFVAWFNSHENELRKTKAEKEYENLKNNLQNAANFYQENSIRFNLIEYKKLGFEFCQNTPIWTINIDTRTTTNDQLNATYGEDRTHWRCTGTNCIVSLPNLYLKFYEDFNNQFSKYDSAYHLEELNNIEMDINSLFDLLNKSVNNITLKLEQKYSELYMQDIRKKHISMKNLSNAWTAYNTEIKNRFMKDIFTDYLLNSNNCSVMNSVLQKRLDQLDYIEDDIRINFMDNLNQNEDLFKTKLKSYVEAIKKTYSIRMNNCENHQTSGTLLNAPPILSL